jgi:hypothetical protein
MSGDVPLSTRLAVRARRWKRKYLKIRYGNLYREASAILFRHDPIGIAFDNENTGEYDTEVGTILPRLAHCQSPVEVRRIVFEEFCKWFTPEVAGKETNYDEIAEELWALWSKNRG